MLAYVARGMLEVSLDDHRLPLELASMLACMLACMSLGMLDYSAQLQLESLQLVCAWFKRFKHVCLWFQYSSGSSMFKLEHAVSVLRGETDGWNAG